MTNTNYDLTLKMNILGGMNDYIRNIIGDDDITDYWNMYGVPDECDEDTLREIAEDEGEFRRICGVAGKIITQQEEDD